MSDVDPVLNDENLPDSFLYRVLPQSYASVVWQPVRTMVVMGRSNQANRSVILNETLQRQIPVIQRRTGGETVVLSPNMLVISAVIPQGNLPDTPTLFRCFLQPVVDVLTDLGIPRVEYAGTSDLCIQNRKILGSAMYRNRVLAFFHAVLNVAEDPAFIACLLAHPGREPDYRKGRNHAQFVTSLHEEGYRVALLDTKDALSRAFQRGPLMQKN